MSRVACLQCIGIGLLCATLTRAAPARQNTAEPDASGKAAAVTPAPTPQDLLDAAQRDYDAAIAARRTKPRRAEQLFQRAAGAWLELRDRGFRNPAIEFNLGNAYVRLNDFGRAVLHYRRAAKLDPTDGRIAANLAFARDRVTPEIDRGDFERLTRGILFWHFQTTPQFRTWFAIGAATLGWLLLAAWLRRRSGLMLSGALVLLFLGLSNATSVGWELYVNRTRPSAVVVAGPHPLLKGPGAGYDAKLRDPLGPGVELRILETRGDYARVRLLNDATGWLPRRSLERI